MMPTGLFARLASSAKDRPKLTWATLVVAVVAIAAIAALVVIERTLGWPEWLVPTPVERWPEVMEIPDANAPQSENRPAD